MPVTNGWNVSVDATQALAALAQYTGPQAVAKLAKGIQAAALLGERLVAEGTPVDTGVLRGGVKASARGPLTWVITDPVNYTPMVEEGTRAHEIRPRAAKVLAFSVGGSKVFARRVRHPGTRGAHMFQRAAAQLRTEAPRVVLEEIRR